MRPRVLTTGVLAALLALAGTAGPTTALAGDGGAEPTRSAALPSADGGAEPVAGAGRETGGASPAPRAARRNPARRVRLAVTLAAPGTGQAGSPVPLSYRIDGEARLARVLLEVRRRGVPPRLIDLGRQRVGTTLSYDWLTAAAGRYVLHVRASASGRARGARDLAQAPVRVAPTPAPALSPAADPPAPPPLAGLPSIAPGTTDGRFPLVGAHDFGHADARFGVPRPGHIHQGQDVVAAEGTPIVAPRAGTIVRVAYQAHGAGHYVILRDAPAGRDLVFMHLRSGSVAVAEGDAVRIGQRLGEVGHTGDASGPHLHFEIWQGGWRVKGGAPIDPLPQLQRWDAGG